MSDDKRFSVGDIVSLNSGGHSMTVLSANKQSVSCVWSVRGDIKKGSFPAHALKETEADANQSLAALIKESMKLDESTKLQSLDRENAK